MDRRTFISSATLGLLAAPLAAEAQSERKVWRIGFVEAGSASVNRHFLDAFRQGLADLGYVEGQQIAIEDRWADGRVEAFPGLLAEVIRLKVDVIVVSSGNGGVAAKRATTTIPTVFFVDDPVRLELAASFARPGRNMTGLAFTPFQELLGKWVQLLKDLVPKASSVALLGERTGVWAASVQDWRAAAKPLGVTLESFEVGDPRDFDRAFNRMGQQRLDGVIVRSGPLIVRFRDRIVELAARYRLPGIYSFGEFVRAGGLMAYGPSVPAVFQRMAYYVDRILKGAKPADLPVEQPTKFELIINLKAAKALGLTIPQSLLQRADQVIE
jgi:putative ABC transport system substrate-binding protein